MDAQLATFGCLLDHNGAKNSGTSTGCRKTQHECELPRLWRTWWIMEVAARREALFLTVKCWCTEYSLHHEKLTRNLVSLCCPCKLREPSRQKVCKKTGFNAYACVHSCPVVLEIFQYSIYYIIHSAFFGCNQIVLKCSIDFFAVTKGCKYSRHYVWGRDCRDWLDHSVFLWIPGELNLK